MGWITTSASTTTGMMCFSIQGTSTNCATGITGTWYAGGVSGGGVSGNSVFTSGPRWTPQQVAQLQQDYNAVKQDRLRKKAEIKARRLFKRTVGDMAYELFKQRGHHEIHGASRARYRLLPGRWVRVMGQGEEVLYELCAHLPFGVPWFDTMAVQHLMLTSCKETEDRFLSIANKHTAGIYPIDEMAA